jgi:hypothetical protein
MDTIKDTVNSALEKLNITGSAPQGTPAKEPSEEQLNELKSKYQKAGQEQVFVRVALGVVVVVVVVVAGRGAPRWALVSTKWLAKLHDVSQDSLITYIFADGND